MKRVNFIVSITLIAASIILFISTGDLTSRAALMPRIITILLGIFGALLLVQTIMRKDNLGHNPFLSIPWVKWVFVIGSWALSFLLMQLIGFYVAYLIFIIVVTWVLDGMKQTTSGILTPVIFGIGFMLVVYIIFGRIFQLGLP